MQDEQNLKCREYTGTDAINVEDVALIFEGGGTRAAHTAGVLNTLLDNGIYFKDVFGISAGSSHTINYVSRDTVRARASFVEFMGLPGIAGARQFLRGKGYFNAEDIYQRSGLADGLLPFNYDAFMASPSEMHIAAYQVDTGATATWTRADVHSIHDLMNYVQASSSMPIAMPIVRFGGHLYYDGGLGSNWGIALDEARALGYTRFFVVCTQEKGYRKKKPRHPWLNYLALPAHPGVARRCNERWSHYNALYDELDTLEASGEAIVYHPEEMPVGNTCCDVAVLQGLYEQGYLQAHRELPRWKEFLGLQEQASENSST
ncbi:MAG: patatin family protein [Coriobacteriales bacterium]|nr:patatin family protein [Coriobacteriales bacterium]